MSEIDELLSPERCWVLKQAGFPQKVEVGDWVLMPQPIGFTGKLEDYGYRLVTEDISDLNPDEDDYIRVPAVDANFLKEWK